MGTLNNSAEYAQGEARRSSCDGRWDGNEQGGRWNHVMSRRVMVLNMKAYMNRERRGAHHVMVGGMEMSREVGGIM